MQIIKSVIERILHQVGWVQYTGGNPQPLRSMVLELQELNAVLEELVKSHEYYTAMHKPADEWDEYDYMMSPVWIRLGTLMNHRKVDNS